MKEGPMSRVPVLPVRDIVLFPGIIVPLFVGRPRSLKALEDAMLKERKVLVLAQREMQMDDPTEEDLFRVGTLCHVLQMVRVPDGTTEFKPINMRKYVERENAAGSLLTWNVAIIARLRYAAAFWIASLGFCSPKNRM